MQLINYLERILCVIRSCFKDFIKKNSMSLTTLEFLKTFNKGRDKEGNPIYSKGNSTLLVNNHNSVFSYTDEMLQIMTCGNFIHAYTHDLFMKIETLAFKDLSNSSQYIPMQLNINNFISLVYFFKENFQDGKELDIGTIQNILLKNCMFSNCNIYLYKTPQSNNPFDQFSIKDGKIKHDQLIDCASAILGGGIFYSKNVVI